MILILGAAHAGKRCAAQQFYHIQDFCDGDTAAPSEVLASRAVCHYHQLVRRLILMGESPQDFTKRYLAAHPDGLIIMNEIGCGIVPLEREERIWREECGICARILAEKADTVLRVVCGIAQAIKGELP